MKRNSSLADHLERLETTVKQSPVVFFQQDRELRYIWVYNGFPGWEEQSLLGQTDAALLPEDEARQLMEVKQSVMMVNEPHQAVVRVLRNGQSCFYQWMIKPLTDDQGAVVGVQGLVVELSDSAERESRAGLLASLSRSFAASGNDLPSVLQTVAWLVAQQSGEACIIQLLDQEGNMMEPAAFYHTDQQRYAELLALFDRLSHQDRKGLLAEVSQEGSPLIVENLDARADLLARLPDALREWLRENPIHGLLVLPLRTARGLLGMLGIWRSHKLQPYTAGDRIFWQEVADQAALAIENARLYSEEVNRNRQLNALHDASTALLAILDLEDLLGRILDAAQTAIPAAETGVLYLVAPSTGRLEVRATSGFKDPRIRRTGQLHNSHARRAMRERQPLLLRDTAQLTGMEAGQESEAFRSAIFAPLTMGAEVLGTLSLSSATPSAFRESDLQLLVSFAATTTAALHNAMLHAELQKVAITDPLTGLYNRRGLLELGRREIERFERFGTPLSAIMLDIDHFKQVNDTYGHSVGDQVLRGLADRCRTLVRLVDILGRYGGEEFVVVLPETDLFQAAAVAERLRRAIEEQPFETEQGPITITTSLGVSRARQNLSSLVGLIEQTDAALYQAKQNGRNRVEIS